MLFFTKNPNGYGSVYKLSGKRRKPFGARITTGWTEEGKQQYRIIGYYATRPEAMMALADYHKNPYSIEASTVTFSELFTRWSEEKFDKISHSNVNGYNASYKVCGSLYNMKFVEIKKVHLQSVVDSCGKNYPTLKKLKCLFNQLYKFALENDIVTKDYSRFVDIGSNENTSSRSPFTEMEIKTLFENVHRLDYIDTILIMIFTGLRVGELLTLRSSDVHIDERYMRGGIKTPAGKNRVIPLNKKIIPYIKKYLGDEGDTLIVNYEGLSMAYDNYYNEKWKRIMEQLEMNHKPHDCRHTFATLMDNAGANKLCIKRIMGHASSDITDRVYTHKDIQELIKAVDSI